MMGNKMSVNEDLIHSIKKMRVSNADDEYVNDKYHTEVRLYDTTSPCSPFRKQYGGKKSLLDRATRAPFEKSPTFDEEDEQIIMKPNNYIECTDISTESISVANMRVINSKFLSFSIKLTILFTSIDLQSNESALLNENICKFDDSYSNDELATFMVKQQESHASLGSQLISVSEKKIFANKTCCMIRRSLDLESALSLEPSNEEIIGFLKAL